ncbi:MAG: sigma 54-interacting transcriptional regulator [Nannocystis sp.]|nr:sigma-54-dependent Fis family transcriptional regulator [Nannocystis sp.]MBA3545976.1 sigma 54-interacting transcriptional regulator [Nannocystis sp.]
MRAEDLDIHALLAVDPQTGVVRFAGERALIVDATAMGALRRDLVDALGLDGARALLLRFGHAQGSRAAEAMRERFAWDDHETMREAGGRLGLLQGMLRLAPGTGPMTPGGATVPASYEAEQHLLHCGRAEVPVCWTLAGFASGYLSGAEGRDIVVLEDRCLARGDDACRFNARPREAWGALLDGHHAQVPANVAVKRLVADDDLLSTRSPAMRRVLELTRKLATVDSAVLILGDSGTGKDRIARHIHARSARAAAPFVALHCGAMAEPLLESELFGHARGAFTGAARDRIGLLEAAGAGTLFLDEVGEMSPAMQVKLLRALQQREIRRIGENHVRPIHARVLAATHRDLAAAVTAGSFRRDLYYRLRVIELRVPPLRERLEDILPLAESFLAAAALRLGRQALPISPAAALRLRGHTWPGNVRELEHAMERAAALATGPCVEPCDLPDDLHEVPPTPTPSAATGTLQQLEHAAILAALARHGGQQRAAAAELGISASTLYRRLRSFGP